MMKISMLKGSLCVSLFVHIAVLSVVYTVRHGSVTARASSAIENVVTFEVVVLAEEPARSVAEVVPLAAKIDETAFEPVPIEPMLKTPDTETKLPLDIEEALPVAENETAVMEAQSVPTPVDETRAIWMAGSSFTSVGDTTNASNIRQPYYLLNPKPIYPSEARRRKQEGLVILSV